MTSLYKLRIAPLVLICVLLACATALGTLSMRAPTLHVQNRSGEFTRVYVDGTLLGTALNGSNCFSLRHLRGGSNVLTFRSLSNGIVDAPSQILASHQGWEIELHHSWNFDVHTLMASERCEL